LLLQQLEVVAEMSIESANATESTDDGDITDGQFESELVAVLRGLGEDVEPWKLRPPESSGEPAKLLVGARIGLVRGQLEGVGYEIHELGLPVEDDGWIAVLKISPES
jgi:anti-sigma factor ChrR (cupin superfamily)